MKSMPRFAVLRGRLHLSRSPILIMGAAFLLAHSGCRENAYQPPPPPRVTVAYPLEQTIVTGREFTGRTAPVESVEIRARVQGFLQSMEFEEGTQVEAGQVLYVIEPAEYEAAVQAAEAQVTIARSEMDRAQADYERVKKLYEQQSAAKMEMITSKAAYEKAEGQLQAAQANLTESKIKLGYTRISAPIAGRINKSAVDIGNLVGQNEATVLSTIVPWNPLHVYVTVSERDVLEWRRRVADDVQVPRIEVFLQLVDGSRYPQAGVIDYIDNRIDPKTGTLQVRAEFQNPKGLLVPGSFVRLQVPGKPTEAILVPETATQRDLSGHYLMVLDDNNTVQRRDITLGPKYESCQAVLDGLADGERVIVKGLQRVRPGIVVEPEVIELPSPESAPAVSTSPSETQPTDPN